MLLYEEFIYRIFLSGISFGYKGKRTRKFVENYRLLIIKELIMAQQ